LIDCPESQSRKKPIKRSERQVCSGTGSHCKAKWDGSLNAERAAIFAEMPKGCLWLIPKKETDANKLIK